ncbi:MAG: SDR family NAD(P)-dependent oxidoreductase [Marinibacterium sp.]|nr:SDR family NAD(P)-dependent oxidoreductase [Marinibacterium sp.]
MNDPLSDQMDFSGRVALVSGGTSGIGRVVVRQQGELDAKLAVADRNHEGAKDVVAELGADNAMAIAVDVADPDSDHSVLWATARRLRKPSSQWKPAQSYNNN